MIFRQTLDASVPEHAWNHMKHSVSLPHSHFQKEVASAVLTSCKSKRGRTISEDDDDTGAESETVNNKWPVSDVTELRASSPGWLPGSFGSLFASPAHSVLVHDDRRFQVRKGGQRRVYTWVENVQVEARRRGGAAERQSETAGTKCTRSCWRRAGESTDTLTQTDPLSNSTGSFLLLLLLHFFVFLFLHLTVEKWSLPSPLNTQFIQS